MFAVVETGGKQYKVAPGDQLDVERLSTAEGEQFDLGRVLMVGNDGGQVLVGTPIVEGARVVATVVTEHRGDKIIVFKYKAKKRYRLKMGHRQTLTRVSIDDIIADGIEDDKTVAKAQPTKAASKKASKAAAATVAAPDEEDTALEASAAPVQEVATPEASVAPVEATTTPEEVATPEATAAPVEEAPAAEAATPAEAGEADLEWVDGIGPAYNRILGEHGIHSNEDLANATLEQLHATGINRDDEELASWIQQAKDKLAGE